MTSLLETPVARLHQALKPEIEQVNTLILERLSSDVPLISEIAKHLIKAGGKRLRPLLTLASARLFNEKSNKSVYLAAAVELIHTATLLHDDVVDASNIRRGQQTANDRWGNTVSVLVGDFLFARAFQLMVECEHQNVLDTLATASTKIAEGEILQLSACHDLDLSVETYLKIISSKTAALFAASCKAGGSVVDADPSLTTNLYEFGYNLGMAFQIMDDILDYTAISSDMGKTSGNDFYEAKVTLPVILICQKKIDREFWNRCFVDHQQEADDFEKAVHLLNQHDIFSDCIKFAHYYAEKAHFYLYKLPLNGIRNDLEGLIDYSLSRKS